MLRILALACFALSMAFSAPSSAQVAPQFPLEYDLGWDDSNGKDWYGGTDYVDYDVPCADPIMVTNKVMGDNSGADMVTLVCPDTN